VAWSTTAFSTPQSTFVKLWTSARRIVVCVASQSAPLAVTASACAVLDH